MGAIATTKYTLASAVADGGTFTVAYPSGTDQALLTGTTGSSIAINANDVWKQGSGGATFTFGASNITVTNDSDVTWAAGSEVVISFGRRDINGSYNLTNPKQVQDKVADLETRVADLETP